MQGNSDKYGDAHAQQVDRTLARCPAQQPDRHRIVAVRPPIGAQNKLSHVTTALYAHCSTQPRPLTAAQI